MSKIFHIITLFCRRAFYKNNSKTFVIINDLLSVVIIVSIIVIMLETVTKFSKYNQLFLIIEYIAVIIFSIEYIARIIGSQKKMSYIFSFFGLIDLISILPTWLHISNLTPLKSIRTLRILRFLRIMRLTKITRIRHIGRPSKEDAKSIIRINLQIYLLAIIFIITILGNFVYIFEHNNPYFQNIPLSMLWILESLLGGSISSAGPQTYAGIIIFMIARFFSYILLGFLIHIISGIISYILIGKKTNGSIINDQI